MLGTVKYFSKIICTVKKSRILDFLLIISLSVNGVHNINTGFHAKQGDFKYVVSIRLSDAHLCTGTIIDETHILTIWHVFIGKLISKLSVVGGMTVIMHPLFHSIPVRKIFPHPEFRKLDAPGKLVEDYWVNDIAILRLTDRFYWNSNYRPVQLMQSEVDWSSCLDCVMISWQYPLDNSNDLITQMWNFIDTPSEAKCLQSGVYVLENEQCFDILLQNSLITSGDLGSPIVCGGMMIGLVTKVTNNIATRTPSTLLKTMAHSKFIKTVLTNAEKDVRPREVPFVVSIWHDIHFLCGGLILDATHILTAGHCIMPKNKTNLRVASGYAGASQTDSTMRWLSVHDIIFHPLIKIESTAVNDWYIENDIAVVVLQAPVTFGWTFDLLHWLKTNNVRAQLNCNTFHWRLAMNNAREMVTLKMTLAKILPDESCQKRSVSLIQWQFCAGNPFYMHIANYKDIGNPIICEGRPVGIIVRAFPLNDESPPVAIFLQLHPYEEFIRSAMSRS